MKGKFDIFKAKHGRKERIRTVARGQWLSSTHEEPYATGAFKGENGMQSNQRQQEAKRCGDR
eukprot:6174031-Pleurochrysis_carterae.AAC.1